MTEAEEQQLRELAEELSSAGASAQQPRCIVRAFARPERSLFVLTLQGWIDLEAIDSPILLGLAPEGEDAPEQIRQALAVFESEPDWRYDSGGRFFAFDPTLIEPEEALAIVSRMIAAVRLAFSTFLRMTAPGAGLGSSSRDGFGSWLPLLACLVTQCGMSRLDALATPVCQAFALVAAKRRNDGWHESGEPYNLRSEPDGRSVSQEEEF